MRYGRDEVLRLARAAETVIAVKGTKMHRFDPADTGDDELLAKLLGPSGNLRAPALKRGKTLVVGFSAEVYSAVL